MFTIRCLEVKRKYKYKCFISFDICLLFVYECACVSFSKYYIFPYFECYMVPEIVWKIFSVASCFKNITHLKSMCICIYTRFLIQSLYCVICLLNLRQ